MEGLESKVDTIPEVFRIRVLEGGKMPALLYRGSDGFESITWQGFGKLVRELAFGLLSLGIKKGDCIGILSENRPEWAIADLAILSIGGVSVPIYPSLTPHDIAFIAKDASLKVIIASDSYQVAKLNDLKGSGVKIVSMDRGGVETIQDVMDRGRTFMPILAGIKQGEDASLNLAEDKPTKDDLASIIYTSGTTGRPKGVMLTHQNFLSNIRASLKRIEVGDEDIYLSILPLSHVFERMVGLYLMIHQGATIAYSKGITSLFHDIHEVKPTIMIGIPWLFSRLKMEVLKAVERGSPIRRSLFWWAYRQGKEVFRLQEDRSITPFILRLKHFIADRLVLSKVRKRISPNLRLFISGGAPLSEEVGEFFWSVGLPLLEGYGLTETSPVVSVNTLKEVRLGTVGKAIPGVEVKISEDGEICVRGENVMKGYLNLPQETSLAFKDGWFVTGDIGMIDKDGFIKILDRKKDIIITSLGKNISPQKLERLLEEDEYIRRAVVLGDKRPYLIALICPEFEMLEGIDGLVLTEPAPHLMRGSKQGEGLYSFFERRVRDRMRGLPRFEQVRRFAILDRDLSIEAGELTPTLKVKRRVVEERYKEVIDRLYDESAKGIDIDG